MSAEVVSEIKIFYTDGSDVTIRPTAAAWRGLPKNGVQIVLEYMEFEWALGKPYRVMLDGGDYYWLDAAGRVQCVRSSEKEDEWREKPPVIPEEDLKYGEWITAEAFDAITDIAMADHDRPVIAETRTTR